MRNFQTVVRNDNVVHFVLNGSQVQNNVQVIKDFEVRALSKLAAAFESKHVKVAVQYMEEKQSIIDGTEFTSCMELPPSECSVLRAFAEWLITVQRDLQAGYPGDFVYHNLNTGASIIFRLVEL